VSKELCISRHHVYTSTHEKNKKKDEIKVSTKAIGALSIITGGKKYKSQCCEQNMPVSRLEVRT
jgi:hypothetical protein